MLPVGVVLVGFTVLGSVVAAVIGVAVHRRASQPLSRPLSVMLFAVAAWALPYGISLTCGSLDCVLFWQRLRYPGTVVAPVAYLVVALRYAGHDRWCTPTLYGLLGVVPALSLAVIWTNPFHGLFWTGTAARQVAGVTVFVESFGPWRPVFLGYLYLVTVATLAVLAAAVVRSGRLYRKQALMLFAAGLVPLVANAFNEFVAGPGASLNLTPPSMVVTGVAVAVALLRFDLLDLQPVARSRLVEELDDGVVVVGPDGRIRDRNPVAGTAFPEAEPGTPVEAVFPEEMAADGGEVTAETDTGERVFRLRTTPLVERGDRVGRILHLRDVTEVVEREQRLSVLNRVLRHNIRNELNVISGSLGALGEELPAESEAQVHLDRLAESADNVVGMAEKARTLDRTLRHRGTTVPVPVDAAVRRVVETVAETHPTADFAVETPENDDEDASGDGTSDPPGDDDAADHPSVVHVVDEELFEVALTELIENAVEHNRDPAPNVRVEVEPTAETVAIRVIDDGPGIPEMQTAVLGERTESQLDHGSGLGLWLAEWTTTLSGGDLDFADREPTGTVVTMTLPRESLD